ncbi:hypothetical protein HanXRQr2_Chr12g0523071 [Helianthus annuus]|uniref:Uncharacterized protein n=1 Tax=Helianthus annuus TaxID=4232 RepID=A0A9K3EPB5_HELAN|nr:hypothetical protein HanXRQr2_Chr12g0523071 [Helianthus annuus]
MKITRTSFPWLQPATAGEALLFAGQEGNRETLSIYMECSFQVVTFLACISNMITIGSDIEQPEKNPKKVEQNNIIHICPTHFLTSI